MKRLLIAALLVSMGTIADDAAKIEEPAEAKVEEGGGHKDWPTLDAWADSNKLKEGTLSAEVLLGYEYSDLDGNGTKAAQALLTRTRINYQTANFEGFDARVQAQYVGPVNDHYGPGNPDYDAVADPEAFRLHQAYLAYTGYDSKAIVGSQEIILDNARFIGNVGWRLNAQSFNAGSIKNESVENLKLYYAYADSINWIDGDININSGKATRSLVLPTSSATMAEASKNSTPTACVHGVKTGKSRTMPCWLSSAMPTMATCLASLTSIRSM